MTKLKNIHTSLTKPQVFELSNGKSVSKPVSKTPIYVVIFVILFMVSVQLTDFSIADLITRGNQFWDIILKMIPPDFSYLPKIIPTLVATIQMSIIGTFIGSLVGFPVAFLAASNINTNRKLLLFVRFILSLVRTMPVLIYASILTYFFDFGSFAGVIAISLFTFGIISKMLFEKIETIDMGPFEAGEASGLNKLKSSIVMVVPLIITNFYSMVLYNFEINVRNAAILGYVGAGGIGFILYENMALRKYDDAGMILFVIMITVIIIDEISQVIRKRLN